MLTIRAAHSDDAVAIADVARESWFTTYDGIFDRAFMESYLARAYALEALENQIQRAGDIFLVADDDGVIAMAHFGDRGHGSELFRLYARPARFGTGVGKALLESGETKLRAIGVASYFCMVQEKNERGRTFYERRGFTRDLAGDDGDHLRYVRRL